MGRTINVWLVIVVCACVLVMFFWQSGQFDRTLEELNQMSKSNASRISDLDEENTDLQSTLNQTGTDAYIENVARVEFGFMMPDEIRFVIPDLEVEEKSE